MKVCLLSPTCLIPTEEVDPDRVAELQAEILCAGCWTVPITAEKDALCVMDGHHRLAVAHRLKLPIVPVMLLDYNAVRVESWRPGLTITPASILAMARSGHAQLDASTRHHAHGRLALHVAVDRHFAGLDQASDLRPAGAVVLFAQQAIERLRAAPLGSGERQILEDEALFRAAHSARPRGEFQRGLMCTLRTSRNSPICAQ